MAPPPRKVLFVEDEAALQHSYKRFFEGKYTMAYAAYAPGRRYDRVREHGAADECARPGAQPVSRQTLRTERARGRDRCCWLRDCATASVRSGPSMTFPSACSPAKRLPSSVRTAPARLPSSKFSQG